MTASMWRDGSDGFVAKNVFSNAKRRPSFLMSGVLI
jgi:hypothetical protein